MCLETPPANVKKMKTGHTTGACAAACSKAAVMSALGRKKIRRVELTLPGGKKAAFKINSCEFSENKATATTVKDAGDDPDVTHGAVIGATVLLNNTGEIRFLRGKGVGKVTLPGLGLNVGEPAINKTPRKMMTNIVRELLEQSGGNGKTPGADIKVFVPEGEKLAKKTLNSRLGIKGGISIIGTTGVVRPFSSASYVASIVQAVKIAASNGSPHVVASSGGRSEKFLRKRFPDLPDYAFIQYGNWIGKLLDAAEKNGIADLTLATMIGKAVKLAGGDMDTHSGKNVWNKELIADITEKSGAGTDAAQAIGELNMAGRLTEIFPLSQNAPFYRELLKRCRARCRERFSGGLTLALAGLDGQIVWYPDENG
ncbi:MAG: cobalt-precorrin-5B (C(1))-methyltransferase [Candidatus Dadabacteria bacterium]|nr:cobalt-precorrin-5B (C(1))-methyltransferase [Candidatus Dadabacteria bacterium]